MKKLAALGLLVTFITACDKGDDVMQPVSERILAGGETTIFSSGPDAYTFPLANLDQAGIDKHFVADGIFGQQFVSAPANQFGGIGPLFNQNSCESCHVRNGRGIVPQFPGDPASGLLLRLSIPGIGLYGSILPVPGFGGQLQHKAIFNVAPEGKMTSTMLSHMIQYLDGSQVELSKPTYIITEPYIPLPEDIRISPRLAPPVHGLGLLEAIPVSALIALADESDADGDGISGRPNYVWDVLKQSMEVGRFGWKAEQPTAGQQAADAAHNDMGLTSHYFPAEHCQDQINCQDGLQVDMDADEETTDLFAFYFQTLAVPAARNTEHPQVILGEQLFTQLHCDGCHTPKHTTADHAIASLSNQIIFPYTDMLLHDMGDDLSDNRPTYAATGNEWRTAPLWGIGLAQVVNPKATFLHDGRARSIEEAILWHGGEAEESKTAFMELNKAEREALLAFLHSL